MPGKKTHIIPDRKTKGPKPSEKAKEQWNFAIYMAGDNDLVDESIWALTEINAVSDKLNNIALKVLFDHGKEESFLDFSPKGRPTLLKGQQKDSRNNAFPEIKAATVKQATATNSTADSLKQFIERATSGSPKSFLPTKAHQVVILSGHTNADPLSLLRTLNPTKQLNLLELGKLTDAYKQEYGKLGVLGFDSCTMSAIESIFELHDSVEFLVSAQGNELMTGWPYARMLEAIDKNATSLRTGARLMVSEYIRYYAPYVAANVSTDLAACDLSAQPALQAAVLNLSTELLQHCENPLVESAILVAHWRAQSYKYELMVDLWDFCHLLAKACNLSSVQTACQEVKNAVEACVEFNSYTGAAVQHSHGISIYFPWAMCDWERDRGSYRQLKFAKYTQWDEFLDKFLALTQREPRKRDKECPNGKVGEAKRWVMPLDGGEVSHYTLKEGGKGNIPEGTKGNIPEGTKGNIPEGTKGNIPEGTKGNIPEGTKGNIPEGTKLKGGRIPHIKNPAEQFYRYEDECKV